MKICTVMLYTSINIIYFDELKINFVSEWHTYKGTGRQIKIKQIILNNSI